MIGADVRAALLQSFPRGTPLVVISSHAAEFESVVAPLGDAALVLLPLVDDKLPAHAGLATIANVLVEGIDDVEDAVRFLRTLREVAPLARLFVLVQNAAYLRALAEFFAGTPLARAHPLVHDEIEPLMKAGGWETLAINPIPDDTIPAGQPLPFDVGSHAGITFRITDAGMLERGRTRAFVVVADRSSP